VLYYEPSPQHKGENAVRGYNDLGKFKKNEITVKWKSNDKKLNPDTLSCRCMHRVTPRLVTSSPSICLMKHICVGRAVFLVTPLVSNETITHIMLLQGGEVFLHCLHSSISAEGIPLDVYSKNVDMYRKKDFMDLIDANILQPCPKDMRHPPPLSTITLGFVESSLKSRKNAMGMSSSSVGNTTENAQTFLAPNHLERYTRYFPWTESDSFLYSEQSDDLRRLIDPFKRNMLKETLDDERVDTMTDLLHRVILYAQTNDARLFPQLLKSVQIRKDTYKKLWGDLYTFAQVCATTPQHCKLVVVLEKLWPDACGISPLPSQQQLQSTETSGASSSTTEVAKIKFIKPESLAEDIWDQYEQCRKQLDEDELKAERDRQMQTTTPSLPPPPPAAESSSRSRKRKPADASFGISGNAGKHSLKSKRNEQNSLFSVFRFALEKQQKPGVIFDGQKENR